MFLQSDQDEPDRQTAQSHFGSVTAIRNHRYRRWFDLIWLVYSAFFFIEPIQHNTRGYWAQFALVYCLFLALYVGIIYANSQRRAYICLAGMAVLGAFYFPLNDSASGILIYVVAFAPFVFESLAICVTIFALVSFCLMSEGVLMHLNPWTWGSPIFIGLAVGAGNMLAAQRLRANQKLSLAQEEITHLAKVAERERIARDLHDVLGHTLSVVVLKSELAGKLMHFNPDRAHKEVEEIEQIARSALAEVREAIRGYRSEGLAAELDRARATLDAAGVRLECPSTVPHLVSAQETVLSLIIREAVTNIVRHAHATLCEIALESDNRQTTLIVEDNGRGDIRHEGNGLRGIRERVESLGGRMQITSESGTRLTVGVPA